MLMRYWQAAILAAAVALAANAARAETPPAQSACGDCCKGQDCCKGKPCGATGCTYLFLKKCVEAGTTYDFGTQASGCKTEGCCKSATCCQDKKCCTAKECCKGSKECCKGKCDATGGCCAVKKVKKRSGTPIIVVVPVLMPSSAMPVCGPVDPTALMQLRQQYSGCGMPMPPIPMLAPPGLPQPPMPPQTVGLPLPPPPPCYGYSTDGTTGATTLCPAPSKVNMGIDSWLSLLGMVSDLCCSHMQSPTLPSMCLSALGLATDLCSQTWSDGMMLPSGRYLEHPPQYLSPSPPFPMPRELAAQEASAATILPMPRAETTINASGTPTTVACSVAEPLPPPTPATTVCITADWYGSALDMNINDDDACLSSKKMTMKVGDRQLTLTPVDGRVRVRAPGMFGEADCVRTDRKDRLILKGNAVLRFSKAGQQPQVMKGERIELNLAPIVSVTIESADTSSH
jgi:hypothetical protein